MKEARTHLGEDPMKTSTREAQAPESYGTFWEPLAVDAPAQTPAPVAAPAPDANKDAYLEFVNVTEDTQIPLRTDRV